MNIRDWLYVEDHCSAIDLVLHKPSFLIAYVKDCLGHDRRYGIDATKITDELG
jgi:dTDP-glucose 4,6-dehydratase